jgi:transcriptional regulator with XRE-family HTH domain
MFARVEKKSLNPVDKHVGGRVRMRRLVLAMSQEKLGDALGLTFQQVQKYEKGTNRIGASRLHQISHILQVPVRSSSRVRPTCTVRLTE